MPNPSNLNPVWVEKYSIGTSYTSSTWSYSALCAGIESITPSVKGIAPQYTVSGRRIFGDAAQDHIVSMRYALGQGRKSSFKVELYDGTTLKQTITADCTVTDIVDFGGATTDVVPFSCIIRVNGIPTVTDAN